MVLSACDTAQGRLDYSEGVYGLARALRTAGARNVLVTLWKLNDGDRSVSCPRRAFASRASFDDVTSILRGQALAFESLAKRRPENPFDVMARA